MTGKEDAVSIYTSKDMCVHTHTHTHTQWNITQPLKRMNQCHL